MTDLQIIERPSPNHDARPAGQAIDLLLLHYTGMPMGESALERLCDPAARVRVHYTVEADGRIFQLVTESRRAWHLVFACLPGITDLKPLPTSIALLLRDHEFGDTPIPSPPSA